MCQALASALYLGIVHLSSGQSYKEGAVTHFTDEETEPHGGKTESRQPDSMH